MNTQPVRLRSTGSPWTPNIGSTLRAVLVALWYQMRPGFWLWLAGILSSALLKWLDVSDFALFTMLFIILLTLFWSLLAKQNLPIHAGLVPGQPRALRLALILVWVLFVPALASTLHSPVDAGDLLIMAIWMALWLASLRWPVLWIVISVFTVAGYLATQDPTGQFAAIFYAALGVVLTDMPWVISLGLFVLLGLGVSRLVQSGGATHERWLTRQNAWRVDRLSRSVVPEGWSLVTAPMAIRQILYNTWLRHVLRRPRSKTETRLALGLGGQTHWLSLVEAISVIFVLFAMIPLLDEGTYSNWGFYLWWWFVNLNAMMVFPCMSWYNTLCHTQREQVLLLLLPGAPRGAALNRWLARRWLLQFGLFTLAFVLFALLAMWRQNATGGNDDLTWLALAMVLTSLPLGLIWPDWSRVQVLPGSIGLTPRLILLILLSPGSMALAWVYGTNWGFLPLATLSALLCILIGIWRWRVISTAPQAFPVGQLG